MDSEQKDFKAVKVQMKANQNQGEVLSRSMLYSGINIFGQLSQIYLQNKDSAGTPFSVIPDAKGSSGGAAGSGGDSVMNLSQEVLSIFKRMQKKDPNTKTKALQELERYVDSLESASTVMNQSMQSEDINASSSQSDEMQSLLTFFLYHFCRIVVNEPDKKVREAAHMAFSAFVRKAKRRLGPHLKRIFSLWFCSFFDPSPEVAALAKKNFEAAFPENKRDQVFKIAYKNFLHFANEQLKQSEEQVSEQVGELTKAQREDVFDRITSNVLQALAKSFDFVKEWTDEDEKKHFRKKLIDILDLGAPIPAEVEEAKKSKKTIPQSYLWGFLQPKYRGRVRASCLIFISHILENLPQEVVQSHISQLAPLIHGLIGEDNFQLQTSLWRDALFPLGKTFPGSCWENTNIKKNFLPKLTQTLKASGYGATVALYENFVKFASIFPLYHLINYQEDKLNKASFKERCNIIRETLTALFQGLKNDEAVAYHQELTRSYFETFSFLLLKRVQPLVVSEKVPQEDKDFAIAQMKKCIQLPLEDYINNFQRFNSKVQNERNIRYTIPLQLTKMLRDLAQRGLDRRIYQALVDYMTESISVVAEKANIIRVFHTLLKHFTPRDSTYFKEYVIEGFIVKYVQSMIYKATEETENLGKENIEGLISKITLIQRSLFKIKKFEVKAELLQANKNLAEIFIKIQRKEDMAKSVLSQDILAKFRLVKEHILKAIIIGQSIQSSDSVEFSNFVIFLLQSKNVETSLKVKLLLPIKDLKKLNFNSYYDLLNSESIHNVIMDYLTTMVIQDEKQLPHTWTLIDSGLQLLIQGKPSFLVNGDQEKILVGVFNRLEQIRLSDFLQTQYLFSSIQSLLAQNNSQDKIFEELRVKLFDNLLHLKSSHPSFSPLWAIYSSSLKSNLTAIGGSRSAFFTYCIGKLKQELNSINNLKGTLTHKEGPAQFEAINRFTMIVKSFVQLLPSHSEDRQHVIEEILLQEETFTSNLQSNCLPLKMFRDLFLSGGLGGFDVTKLFSNPSYVWLAAALLNARHLPSLANFIEIKKQLVIFCDTDLIPAFINQVQEGNSAIIIQIMVYMHKQAKFYSDYVYSIEHFIKKMIDPGEDFPPEEKPVLKIEDFKTIFRIVNEDFPKKIFGSAEVVAYSNEALCFLSVLRATAYYIIDEQEVASIFRSSKGILENFVGNSQSQMTQQVAFSLEVFQSLNKYFSSSGESQKCDSLTQQILLKSLQIDQSQSSNQEYSNTLNAILTFASNTLEQIGVSSFIGIVKGKVNFQGFLTWLVELQRTSTHLHPLTYIHLLTIIRKTVHAHELIPDRSLIVSQVLDIAKHQALVYGMKVDWVQEMASKEAVEGEAKKKGKRSVHFEAESSEEEAKEEKEEEDLQVEDFEPEMLQEAAETLLALVPYVNSCLEENDLYILISQGVEALQKAAFVLLKYLYENFIPDMKFKIDDNDMLKQIKQEALEGEKHSAEVEHEEQKGGDHYYHHDQEKVRNKLAFRNVSDILIEILENPPAVESDGSVHTQQVISGSTQLESLIFQEAHNQGQHLNSKVFGYFLAWNALLIKIENGRIKSQLQNQQEYASVLGALNEYLEENAAIYRMLLVSLLAHLPEEKRGLQEAYNVSIFEPEYMNLNEKKQVSLLTVYTLLNFMKSFPSLARKYCQECDRQLLDLVMPYIKQLVSPAILENEIKKIELAQLQLGQSELTFSLFKSTKEILANFKKGEIEMTLKIKIPADYPLKLVEVDVSKQLKISEKQLRKWILAIRKIIQFQNGDIISAVLAWKANIEREIEGVEDCYICYAVVHENDQSLPKMPCKTCKNKFHVACIRKWFRQSHKSNCPICQNYFF